MLKIIQNYQLVDFLRKFNGDRAYGIPIAPNYMALQWQGAYAETERDIVYFLARKIDNSENVITSYVIDIDRIKYENGQYLYDNTKLFDGYLPDGCYFFEFNDGYQTFYTQIFAVDSQPKFEFASSAGLASSSELVSSSLMENPNQIILKQFENSEYFEFEQ